MPVSSGVYRFLETSGKTLYVGKARNLKRRVTSYFSDTRHAPRIQRMLARVDRLEITVTETENEALILEAQEIKRLKPRYNILLKDDKSYPWLMLSMEHDFPKLVLCRGVMRSGDCCFGPYPSVSAVRETMRWLQKNFPVRSCSDQEFRNRQRPCLQHQLKRCGAPCCNLVSRDVYGRVIEEIVLFLNGEDRSLVARLESEMWKASDRLDFEGATLLRDRLKAVRHVQEQRRLPFLDEETLDVVVLCQRNGFTVVQVFLIRSGLLWGQRSYFPKQVDGRMPEEILETFLAQFYADHTPPRELLLDRSIGEKGWLESALRERHGKTVAIRTPQRGEKRRLIDMALSNAEQALINYTCGESPTPPTMKVEKRDFHGKRLSEEEGQRAVLESLARLMGREEAPERIEAYDVSHTGDRDVRGALVVFGPEGFQKTDYRRFSLTGKGLTDDTQRMASMLTRRLSALIQQEERWPDLVLLDGGSGQLNVALKVAEALRLEGVFFCAFAKGVDRNSGRERLFLQNRQEPLILALDDPVRFLLQRIRDEAHRFAVSAHRSARKARQTVSALDEISGVGTQLRRALITQFGSVKGVQNAKVSDLKRVKGISDTLAQRIHRFFNS